MRSSILLALATGLAGLVAPAAAPAAKAPNVRVYVERRIFPPGKPAKAQVSTYNVRVVSLAVYATDIEALVPNAAVLEAPDSRKDPRSVAGRLAGMTLGKPLHTWSLSVKKPYPDAWMEHAVKLPKLASGVYVLSARGGGVEIRTWFAVSTQALVLKRSPDGVQAWLVTALEGRLVSGVPLVLYDAKGRAGVATTGAGGTAGFSLPARRGALWVASRGGEPAFARASSPEEEKPYRVYLYTDRPVYRPGHRVRFRGTIRAMRRGVPTLAKVPKVRVQIKTRGDTPVYDEELPANEWGTFSGEFQLAPEPPLGSYTLEVAIGDFREYAGFEVEAYRKPEFEVTATTPKRHQVGGAPVPVTISARYFFGSPVSGAKVAYRVRFDGQGQPPPARILTAAGLGSAATARIEEGFRGEGRLDSSGKLELAIPTRSVPFDRLLQVHAEVTELAGRPRAADVSTLLTGAQFRLSVEPEREQYQVGQTVPVTLRATDYDDRPVGTRVKVALIEHLTDREGRAYQRRTEHSLSTNKEGRATTRFRVLRPGYFGLEAWGKDADGDAVFASSSFQVTKEKPEPDWPTLEAALDKERYAPGDTAVLRVRTSLVGAWAWLTVEGERFHRGEVVRLTAKETNLKVPVVKEYQPGVSVRLAVIRRGELLNSSSDLSVPAAQKALAVTVTPDKQTYQPGEAATFDVATRDYRGQGVSAEVGLGVVDNALYAIREDSTAHPFDVFWPPQADRVNTEFSLVAAYPGGGYQHVPVMAPSVKAGEAPGIRVRRLFVDTAYWGPSVVTDADGHARVQLTIPDNLTTWRTTARALTRGTAAGDMRAETKVTLPLLVRLALPRFYVQHDEATAAAMVHNYTGTERQVKVTLAAEGAEVQGAAEQTITVPADGIRRLTWPVKIAGTGAAGGAEQVRFLVTADGGEGGSDAMESVLPVFPDGVRRVDAVAGMTDGSATVRMSLPEGALPGKSSLELTLSPSLAGPIFEALDYLVAYPHGCAEQTMDRFLPNIIVVRTLRQLGVTRPEPAMLQRYVQFGLQKLLRYQHQDGGWHWWEFDESDPYLTAYVVYGLAMARDAGYPLAAGPIPRGVDYLRRALAAEQYRGARAYLLWALAYARQWDDKALEAAVTAGRRLYAEREKLDLFSRASLALALDRLSRQSNDLDVLGTYARTLAAELEKDAAVTGTAAQFAASDAAWTANAGGDGSWLDSNVEVTAQVLQALLALRPESDRILPAIRWLMAARRGKEWTSTKDTAAAVLALTAYLKQAKELSPDATVAVRAGERTLATVRLTKEQVFGDAVRVAVPADALRPGENVVVLDKQGAGNLYWSARLSYVLPPESAAPLARGIEVRRRYRVAAEDPVTAGEQPAGSLIEVTLDVVADSAYRYCMLEEPLPAGCEVIVGEEDRYPEVGCERREVWDDRIVYYFDYLPKGERTLSYWIRAESPGAYRIRPSTAELMYFPEVRGEARFGRLKVTEAQGG